MKHLDRKEMRDRLTFLNSMISMQRSEIIRYQGSSSDKSGRPYALGQAEKFQAMADEYQAKANKWKAKHNEFDPDALNVSINHYLSERAKIVFLLSKRGKEIYKVLDSVPQKYHDRFLTALMSAAEDANDPTVNSSEKLSNVLKEILMEGKE